MGNALKTTPLNRWHRANNANMAEFGGFDMPLWYATGVKNEHLAVLESAGIFDTSHMACVTVRGDDALNLLQRCHTRDLAVLAQGRCVYGAILDEQGHTVDDAIVYCMAPADYMVCVNAGMGAAVAAHLSGHGKKLAVAIEDLTGKIAKIDIQGKNSLRILKHLIQTPEQVFDTMPYFSFKGHMDPASTNASQVVLTDGTPVLLSRSGYTGEFGFEIFIAPEKAVDLWTNILGAGKAYNVTACGLGARDSLRAGAVLPLSHQDIGPWKFINHPWMFALSLKPDGSGFTKAFIGDKALLDPKDAFYTYAFVGENLRKVSSGQKAQVFDLEGNLLGSVLTCATDMGIGWVDRKIVSITSPDRPEGFVPKGLSCGFVRVNLPLEMGSKVVLKENKRTLTVTIVTDVRPHRTARQKISNFI